ncbi:Gfo/Idh/MocA family protein [Paenibacillus eucommiae]|uniref:Dehydrogenase n=1 Tax=Paenibacillus eucommiae TaxID=1355755 RepID=A0ABS4ILV8_9BACL|nr:Gfo/Idh/MocA family oxidoreductase [Paenibacillus eucommiae]MBP1988547.1 putative dehydrogenase [Paenibacillus eucommiae]
MTVKIGFIGVGGIAQLHIDSLLRINDVKIVSVFDVNGENAAAVAAKTGAEVVATADQVLDPSRIDAVFICTPQFAREDLEEVAAGRGIHLFVEKPLGLDVDVVRKKEQTIREAGVIQSVGYCLRYLDTVQKAKAYLAGRSVHLIQAFRFGGAHPARWWNRLETSGGHLVDAVTHQIDMIRYISGEFSEVEAKFGRVSFEKLNPDVTIYDAGAITFTMESGAVGNITESCLSPHYSASDIKVFGPDFFLHLSNNGHTLTIIDSTQNITETTKVEAYFEQSKAFIEAVISGSQAPILSSYAEGLQTLAVTLAANKSFEARATISV